MRSIHRKAGVRARKGRRNTHTPQHDHPQLRTRTVSIYSSPGEIGRTVHGLRGQVEQLAHLGPVGHVVEELHQLQVVVFVAEVAL